VSSKDEDQTRRCIGLESTGYWECAKKTAKRENQLWLMAIGVMLGLTLIVDTLDLALWVERGVHHGILDFAWNPAVLRIALTAAVAGVAFYFHSMASELSSSNRKLICDLASQTKLLLEKNAQIERLRHLSESLIGQTEVRAALDMALEMAVDVIGARTASIMLIDPQTDEMTIAAAKGISEDIIQKVRVKVGEGLSGFVAREGEAVVINSDELDERLEPLAHRTKEIRSAIIAPIKIDGKVAGVINVSDKRGSERWGDEDLAVISTLAGQAAMVLQKISLYDSLQKQVVMLEDALSQLRKTQAELVQTEKLASIGQLAGGVAHEINNPLLVILGRAEFAMDKIEDAHPAMKDLDVIHTQTERIAEIVRNLLSFSRTSKIEDFRPVSINEVIERTIALTEHQASVSNISTIREFGEELPLIWGNPGQLQQVFVNLCINACQAMRGSGGSLTVTTWQDNGKVIARFQDTGPGISEELREQIFEPFFTTKDETEGTGLGLAISRGIIHAHQGKIEAGSEPGKGAAFTIELPILNEASPNMEDVADEHEADNDCGRRDGDSGTLPRCA
jgi:signal transduction histidine kinase